MSTSNKDTFYDDSISTLEKDAKKSDKLEHFAFLKYLINAQGIHKYKSSVQYEKVYLSTLDTQLKKYSKRKK